MKKFVYCVRDDLNGFMTPFLAPSDAFAKRDFSAAVNNDRSNSALAYSPNDFALYNFGTFDVDSGTFELEKVPVLVCRGGSLVVDA